MGRPLGGFVLLNGLFRPCRHGSLRTCRSGGHDGRAFARGLHEAPLLHCAVVGARTQRLQYPLSKEYTLNHIRDPILYFKVYSLIKGYWSLWKISRFGVGGFGVRLKFAGM